VRTLTNDVWEGNLSYDVTTKVFARSVANQTQTSTFQITNNKVTLLQPASLTFQVLGGDITCGAGGPTIPVATSIYLNNSTTPVSWSNTSQPLQIPRQASGTTADVQSVAGNGSVCSGYSMTVSTKTTPNQQVMALVNGDSVPNITPFANQSTIDAFLRGYIQNEKISLPNNQVIYLFELGTTNKSDAAFDMQDNVVLATINPAN
jgi:hypothetical protein